MAKKKQPTKRSGKVPPGMSKRKVNRNYELDSKYHEDYPYMLMDHMKEGLSFEAFGGIVMVSVQTLCNWVEKYPKFQKARDIGKSLGRIYWEREGIEGMKRGKEFNSTVWVFNMKNRFAWHDEMKHVISGAVDFNQKIDTKYLQRLMTRDPFVDSPGEKDVTPKEIKSADDKKEAPII